ncbi:hypothetical protein QFZ77_004647 [Paenibacillus sp. V4I3]|uniref:hypothetical protein n=1 Tax=unclassified Paenibacillus TaxID=185978 RepID=UPI0027891C88|nr:MULTISPECIES: hypothetical protein [unclassified Paenibacillus]MDQ0875988.1 hypothetical protein [Paenibacillus sp. V4I3]MDQ0887996.1 hypothetical protein [Paenibacillus sp. V4I9]
MDYKQELIETMEKMDIENAEYWSDQEISDKKYATLAMLRFLRPFQKSLDNYLDSHENWIKNEMTRRNSKLSGVLDEMISAGVKSESIGILAYWISRMTLNSVLYRLDDPAGGDYDLENEGEDLPRWVLLEQIISKENNKIDGKLTGRMLAGMYEVFPLES